MTTAWTKERTAATIIAAGTGIATLADGLHIATFHGRGSPDIASILLLVVITALHFGMTGVNGGLAAALGRRQPRGTARLLVWVWLSLSAAFGLLLAGAAALLATG